VAARVDASTSILVTPFERPVFFTPMPASRSAKKTTLA
jgi:hypothetical protein